MTRTPLKIEVFGGAVRRQTLDSPPWIDGYEYFEYCLNMKENTRSTPSIGDIAAAFAALGQPSRLKIVRLLLSAYPQGLPAGEIQKELEVSAPTLSHHLDKLRQVGIVTARKDRQWIWYSVQSDALKYLIDFLFEECCTRNKVIEVDTLELTAENAYWSESGRAEPECCS